MSSSEISRLVEQLRDKNANTGCAAMKALQELSMQSDEVYPYMHHFSELLNESNSYCRNRALILIAANAKRDRDNKIDEVMDRYLRCITAPKPITARQCIQNLPEIPQHKPELREKILTALGRADVSRYADSMQPLVLKNIQNPMETIRGM